MLDTLSSPVAFATAPLGNPESAENTSANGSGIHSNSRTPTGSGSLGKKSSFLGGDTEADEPILARLGRKFGVGRESGGVKQWNTGKGLEENSSLDEDGDFDDGLFDDGRYPYFYSVLFILKLILSDVTGDDLSESFLVIPSGSEPIELKKQNAALKAELANMQKQLEMADKRLLLREKQDQQLRNSIYQATREVR